jgi:hypothetical protein
MTDKTEPSDDEVGLIRVLTSIEYIRSVAHEKRLLLLKQAQSRVNTKKYIYVLSGSLALISGGAASALVAPAADVIGVKLVAAGLAFISGVIALVTSAFFDEKETAKINEGAGRYGELRDRSDVVLNSRVRKVAELDAIFDRLTAQQSKLQQDFDQWIDVETIQKKSEAILLELNKQAAEKVAELKGKTGANRTDVQTNQSGGSGGQPFSSGGGRSDSFSKIVAGPVFNVRPDNI